MVLGGAGPEFDHDRLNEVFAALERGAALETLPVDRREPSGTSMGGDDLHSDMLGAQPHGFRGVLVRTGRYRERELNAAASSGQGRTDTVIESVAGLSDLLGPS